MSTRPPSLRRFVLDAFICFPPCFAAWYFNAQYHAAVVSFLAHQLLNLIVPDIVSKSAIVSMPSTSSFNLSLWTTLQTQTASGAIGALLIEVKPLAYTYGLALFVALMLAARAPWWKILVGSVVLLPFQGWSIAFDFLAELSSRLGPEIAKQAGLGGWHKEIITLGYQLGGLIFPSLLPIILWVGFCQAFIERHIVERNFFRQMDKTPQSTIGIR